MNDSNEYPSVETLAGLTAQLFPTPTGSTGEWRKRAVEALKLWNGCREAILDAAAHKEDERQRNESYNAHFIKPPPHDMFPIDFKAVMGKLLPGVKHPVRAFLRWLRATQGKNGGPMPEAKAKELLAEYKARPMDRNVYETGMTQFLTWRKKNIRGTRRKSGGKGGSVRALRLAEKKSRQKKVENNRLTRP